VQILANNIVVSLFAYCSGFLFGLGTLYILGLNGLMLGAVFAWMAYTLWRQTTKPHAVKLFHYSMIYLALLFLALAVDRSIWA